MSRAELLVNVLKAFERYYAVFRKTGDLSDLRQMYGNLLVSRDKEVRVLDPKGEYQGIARGINETGELLVEKEDGVVTAVYAGAVSVRGIYGYV